MCCYSRDYQSAANSLMTGGLPQCGDVCGAGRQVVRLYGYGYGYGYGYDEGVGTALFSKCPTIWIVWITSIQNHMI